jgi:hypothetical protein
MLRANHAVRLGLRASSRNPELAFVKALVDQAGSLLAVLPLALGALLVFAVVRRWTLQGVLRALQAAEALRWPVFGGVLAAFSLLFLAGTLFWAAAIPLLAADAEIDRRPPAGNFALLLSRGAARTLVAGALGSGISLLFTVACSLALLLAVPLALARPSALLFALTAIVAAALIMGSILLDVLARLMLIRAAAFGDSATAAFGNAASLLGARLGSYVAVTLAFVVLELIAGAIVATLTGFLSGVAFLDPRSELLAVAPRIAVGLATAAVFAWLEVGRMGALSALAADAEGLIAPEEPPRAELVIEALPADEP